MQVCLVGVTNPCHNPRLVREADTLARAGCDVRVVTIGTGRGLEQNDARLLKRRDWRLERIDLHSSVLDARLRSVWMRGRRRLASVAFQQLKWAKLAEYSSCTSLPELTKLALARPVDWIIAHTQPALPAAAAAAKRWNARLGFDCEDLLTETEDKSREEIQVIERRYIPECHYISAASDCMAAHLQRNYNISAPVVLYNVFPRFLAAGLSPPNARRYHPKLRLHWFSQTLGPDRGLEDVFEACTVLPNQVEIHLRGHGSGVQRAFILQLAERFGLVGALRIHPLIDHDELIKSMGEYDVGLALERPQHRNYSRTVTNKLFSYMMAGLAIASTDTPGQREVMTQAPGTGAIYPSGDANALQRILQSWIADPERLRQAQQSAWEAARSKFCWDLEQSKFLDALGLSPETARFAPASKV